jgi:VanZ family protein
LKNNRGSALVFGIIMVLLIIVLLLLPGGSVGGNELLAKIHIDKIVHFILFATVTIVWCYYFYLGNNRTKTKRIFYLLLAIIFSELGIIMEFLQTYVPDRSFDKWDIVADTMGCFAAYYIAISRFKRNNGSA